MSGQLGELVVSLSADIARFQSDMGKASRIANDNMQRTANDVHRSTQAIERSLGTVSSSIIGAFSVGAVVAFSRELVNAGLAAEKLNMQFKASAGSAQAAAREMGYVKDLSNTLGLNFQVTATAYGKFLASTRNTAIEGNAARKVFEGVSEAATALGLSADESSGIFMALSQMMSKGKVSAEELTGQLGERLPGALKLAADAMGLTTAELMKQMQEGKVMSADLLPKLAAELHKTYGTAAQEAATKGQSGINRFNNEIRETASLIGSKMMPAINAAANDMAELLRMSRDANWGFNPGNLITPLLPGNASISERLALPKTGQDASLAARNARNAASQAAAMAAGSTVDPQMARVEADRRAKQDRINASRATAEKAAAGASARQVAADKAAKKAISEKEEAQRRLNQQVRDMNTLLEQELKGWDALGFGQTLLDKQLAAPATSPPKFSLSGMPETLFYGDNSQSAPPPVDYAAAQRAAQDLADIRLDTSTISASAPDAFGGADIAAQMQAEYDRHQTLLDDLMLAQDVHQEEGLAKYQAYADQRAAIDQRYIKEKRALEKAQWGDAAAIVGNNMATIGDIMMKGNKEQFEAGKKFAIASALINTYMAASSAFAGGVKAAPGPWGVALGVASAAVAVGAGMAQVAAIDAQRYEGREKGGPVNAGQTYIVGEKRPELFTPNQSGHITPYVPKGGKTEVTQVFQISTGVADTVRAEIQRFAPAMVEMSIQGVRSAMRSGEFQGV